MTDTPRKMPKGGRKGGAVFPRITLEKALSYADKLVSKTHSAPMSKDQILRGVFGTAGGEGNVRLSALKQYALLEGEAEFRASGLAKSYNAAPADEKNAFIRQSFLSVKSFKQIFETFHSDKVSVGKIRQQAISLNVHPDSAEDFTKIFCSSVVTAQLGAQVGDTLELVNSSQIDSAAVSYAEDSEVSDEDGTEVNLGDESDSADEVEEQLLDPIEEANNRDEETGRKKTIIRKPSSLKSELTLNLTVDSSSDPDKLAKQLALLKKFGLI